MIKYLIIVATLAMFSCSSDDASNANEPDCDCDRFVQVYTFGVIGAPESPGMHYLSNYTTINDCTQIQREKTFNPTNSSLSPQLGQCR
jgi:hypothetical protein